MEETISCLAVHRFPFSYCEEFLGNGVTYRHKYYLVACGPTRPTEEQYRPRNPRLEINCARWMTYEDAQQAEEFRNTSEVLHSANAEVKLLLGRGIHNLHDFQTFYLP
jgi:hypothetical protein